MYWHLYEVLTRLVERYTLKQVEYELDIALLTESRNDAYIDARNRHTHYALHLGEMVWRKQVATIAGLNAEWQSISSA